MKEGPGENGFDAEHMAHLVSVLNTNIEMQNFDLEYYNILNYFLCENNSLMNVLYVHTHKICTQYKTTNIKCLSNEL